MTMLSNQRRATAQAAGNHPYARLYRAVIVRAMQDLVHKEHHIEAREWLLSPESDHAFATAGISANSIRQEVL
jgi:hypothetical protein